MGSPIRRRLAGGAAAALLILATVASSASPVLGADNRKLFVGEEGGTNQVLEFTSVSAGGQTKTDIYIKNLGKQNLTKAHLLVGQDAAGTLPADVTIVAVLGEDAGACPAITAPVSSLDCDFGSLTSRGGTSDRRVSLVFSTPNADDITIQVAVKVAENVQDVGSNANTLTAQADLTVAAETCDSAATFALPNTDLTLAPDGETSCATDDPQRSSLFVPGRPLGNLVQLDDSLVDGCSSTAVTCFGFGVEATVNEGASVSPFLTWKIFYSWELLGSTNPRNVGFVHDGDLIVAGKKGACTTQKTTNCQQPYVVLEDGVLFTVQTDSNGVMKGYR